MNTTKKNQKPDSKKDKKSNGNQSTPLHKRGINEDEQRRITNLEEEDDEIANSVGSPATAEDEGEEQEK